MTSEKLEQVKEKIRKCMALGESPNEHEAKAALKMAAALLKQYNIDELDIETATSSETGGVINTVDLTISKVHPWVKNLARAVSTAFDCSFYWNTGRRVNVVNAHWARNRDASISFYGITHNVEMAVYSFQSLFNQVNRLAKKFKASHEIFDVQYHYSDFSIFSVAAKREYREGLAFGLLNTIWEQQEADKETYTEEQTTALAVISGEVESAVLKDADIHLRYSAGHRSQAAGTGSGAHAQGKADSSKLNMNTGINS